MDYETPNKFANPKKSRAMGLSVCAFAALASFVVDVITLPAYSFVLFYLLPVIGIAWLSTRLLAVTVSLFCIGCSSIATYMVYPEAFNVASIYWNILADFGCLGVAAVAVSAIKTMYLARMRMARIDSLTGFPNGSAFYDAADAELIRLRRYRRPFVVAYVDLDNFHSVNETYGHHAGDTLLQIASATIREQLRRCDMVARLGGDEFLLFMPETNPDGAEIAIRKVHEIISESLESTGWNVTCTIGSVAFIDAPDSVKEMIGTAGTLVREAKQQGPGQAKHDVYRQADSE